MTSNLWFVKTYIYFHINTDGSKSYTLIQVTSEEFADLCNTIAIKFQKEPPVCWLLQLLIILCLSCVMKTVLIFGRGLIQCKHLCNVQAQATVKAYFKFSTHSFMKSYSYCNSIILQGLQLYFFSNTQESCTSFHKIWREKQHKGQHTPTPTPTRLHTHTAK